METSSSMSACILLIVFLSALIHNVDPRYVSSIPCKNISCWNGYSPSSSCPQWNYCNRHTRFCQPCQACIDADDIVNQKPIQNCQEPLHCASQITNTNFVKEHVCPSFKVKPGFDCSGECQPCGGPDGEPLGTVCSVECRDENPEVFMCVFMSDKAQWNFTSKPLWIEYSTPPLPSAPTLARILSPGTPDPPPTSLGVVVIIAAAAVVVVALTAAVICFIYFRFRRRKNRPQPSRNPDVEMDVYQSHGPRTGAVGREGEEGFALISGGSAGGSTSTSPDSSLHLTPEPRPAVVTNVLTRGLIPEEVSDLPYGEEEGGGIGGRGAGGAGVVTAAAIVEQGPRVPVENSCFRSSSFEITPYSESPPKSIYELQNPACSSRQPREVDDRSGYGIDLDSDGSIFNLDLRSTRDDCIILHPTREVCCYVPRHTCRPQAEMYSDFNNNNPEETHIKNV